MEKPLRIQDEDKKTGRTISGLESKIENFSLLVPERDIEFLKKNKEIKSSVDLDTLYVFINPQNGNQQKYVEAPHWRTISEKNITSSFESEQGQEFFYTANVKGVGYLKPTLQGKSIDDYEEWNRLDEYEEDGAYGLSGKGEFFSNDGDLVLKSKWLIDKGLRTELFASFGRLKNIYFQGELISVKELREKGVIPSQKKFIPAIGVRLLKDNTRIEQVKKSSPEQSLQFFIETFDIFNKETKDKKIDLPEIKIGDPELEKVYFSEFFRRMGNNLAVLQNIGYICWHAHSANVTLAAEIVDIGPYDTWDSDKDEMFVKEYYGVRRGVLKDIRDIAYGLRYLVEAGETCHLTVSNREELVEIFLSGFEKKIDMYQAEIVQKSSVNAIKTMIQKILNKVVVKGKRLPSLKHFDISDWSI